MLAIARYSPNPNLKEGEENRNDGKTYAWGRN